MNWLRQCWRFVKAVNQHPKVPKWVKYLLGVLLIIPGPVDEFLAMSVLVVLAIWHWDVVTECWTQAKEKSTRP
jgi:hypothetical protein